MESRLSADHLATSDGPDREISILSFLSWPWPPVDGILRLATSTHVPLALWSSTPP